MSSGGGPPLQPTFTGHVATTQDALILFEACLQGHLSHVSRRPHDRERSALIRSGCVFIYEENSSGIKRWTDGVTWSPSRILGNFLVYRELDKPFPPGVKKRANKKPSRRPLRPGEPYPRPDGEVDSYSPTTPQSATFGNERGASEIERQLIGSLIDSYGFKPDGLVKKTMSVTVQGVTHHLVSYYSVHDVLSDNLRTPSQTESLQYIRPRHELTAKQSFRAPIDEPEEQLDNARDLSAAPYGYRVNHQPYPPEFKMHSPIAQPYGPVPPHQSAATGYPVAMSPTTPSYLHAPMPTPQLHHQRSHEYGQFEQPSYNRSYDSLNSSIPPSASSRSLPPTATHPIPPLLPDRSQSQQSMIYPPSNLPSRPSANLSPVPMETRSPASYNRSTYTLPSDPSPVDHQRAAQPSPMNLQERRDGQQSQQPMYPQPRSSYYGEGPPQQMTQNYHNVTPIAHWNSQPPGQ